MNNLNERDNLLLDQVLKSFGNEAYLDRENILKIFDLDEKLASSYIDILNRNNLITRVGETEDFDLPMMIMKNPSAELFIKNGGFGAIYEQTKKEISSKKIEDENLKLQNENLIYSKTIREQEQRIRNLDENNKIFEVIKNYWWLLASLYALGIATSKFLLE